MKVYWIASYQYCKHLWIPSAVSIQHVEVMFTFAAAYMSECVRKQEFT
jgi:hypothetical protein